MPNQSLQLNESDHELLARVRTRLELRQFRSSKSLTITTACGTVTLAGKVASSLERQAIVLIVAHMAGVHSVIDDLAVVQPVITAPKSNVSTRGRRGQVRQHRAALLGTSLIALLAMGTVTGCNSKSGPERVPTFPVSGSVSFQGKPIPGAFVALHPKTTKENVPSPRASVAADGSLKVSTYDGGDGAPEGEYVVTVEWYKPIKNGADVISGPNVIPKKYASPQTSDITIRVATQENTISPIKL
ncbi:BON domain-containing protein [Aeoliella sp. SH292]|uniref:BON domain-containing protein n=1 Tax=Aeoliella sp. SH292 TaxID=3454464 RepID=UPI003F954778